MADQSREPEDLELLLERDSLWTSVRNNIRDLFSRAPEPELHLESRPIPVKSIWSTPKPLKSRLGALAIHLLVIGILLLPFWRPVQTQVKKAMQETMLFVPAESAPPPVTLPHMRKLSGGGLPIPTPKPKLIQAPKLQPVASPTALTPMTRMDLPSIGNIGPVAAPPGIGGGNSGVGPGGAGEGSGFTNGNCIGGKCGENSLAATQPIPIYDPDPPYTDQARQAKFQGTCIVRVLIGADGKVSDPHVVQALGLGLDQSAVKTVLTWRFQPARDKNGKAIPVMADIALNFHLY